MRKAHPHSFAVAPDNVHGDHCPGDMDSETLVSVSEHGSVLIKESI